MHSTFHTPVRITGDKCKLMHSIFHTPIRITGDKYKLIHSIFHTPVRQSLAISVNLCIVLFIRQSESLAISVNLCIVFFLCVNLHVVFSGDLILLLSDGTMDGSLGPIPSTLHTHPHDRGERYANDGALFEGHVAMSVGVHNARVDHINSHVCS